MRKILGLLPAVWMMLASAALAGQDGSLDMSFNPGGGAGNTVRSLALQPDGKIVIGGSFTFVDGVGRNRIARLNPDGSLDTSFDPGSGANATTGATVYAVALLSDGKILIGGAFTSVDGVSRNRIARLEPDGSLDTSFDPGSGANGAIRSLAVQADGKIVIGGSFTFVDGVSRNRIARLAPDGALDTGFDPGAGVGGTTFVNALAVQADGKVLIGGSFALVNGVSRGGLARLNADGSLDTSFAPGGVGGNSGDSVQSLALQSDGKILVGGEFTTMNGVGRNRIARLNPDGSLDTDFDPGQGANASVQSLTLQSDGKILIGGGFTTVDGVSRNRIARLEPDGSLDTSFDPDSGANNTIYVVALQPDVSIVIGGDFTSVDGVIRNRIARLYPAGSLDPSFNPGGGANDAIRTLALQPDGRILIGGEFTSVGGVIRNRIARLNADGSHDTSFDPGDGAEGTVFAIASQMDGKVLIGGLFTTINGVVRNGIARLNTDGSLDTSFNPGGGANTSVGALALQPDGKILIGGNFTMMGGVSRNGIARLNANGSLDASFNPGGGVNAAIWTLAIQPDGRILIGGEFTSVGGVSRNRIARLNADGGLDTSFDPGGGADDLVWTIASQPDGRILIGGLFTEVGGVERNHIARLNPDGGLDVDFDPGKSSPASGPDFPPPPPEPGVNGEVTSLALQPNGKILMGGRFTKADGVERIRIARLNADGSLDTSFDPGGGANATVWTSAVQPDGKILIGGNFVTVDGAPRDRVARLNSASPATIISIPNPVATAGQPYTYAIQGVGTPPPVLAVSGLPGWLIFDGIDTISGTPGEAQIGMTNMITITATNDYGVDEQEFQINVLGAPPVFHSAPADTASVGFPYHYTIEVSGVPAPVLSISDLPEWLSYDSEIHELSGTPGNADLGVSQPITITADNGWGEPAVQTFTIHVRSSVSGSGGGGSGGGGCVAGSRGGMWGLLLLSLPLVLGATAGRRKRQRVVRA